MMNSSSLHLHTIPFTLDVFTPSPPPPSRPVIPIAIEMDHLQSIEVPGTMSGDLEQSSSQQQQRFSMMNQSQQQQQQQQYQLPPQSNSMLFPPPTDSKSVSSATTDLQKMQLAFPEFSMGQLRTYYDQFNHFDTDGSGDIDVEELESVMESMGQPISQAEARRMISQHDSSRNGTISFRDFLSMLAGMRKGEDGGKFGQAFNEVFEVGSLLTAASKGDGYQLALALDNGISANSADYDNRTALHLAAAEGHLDAVRTLLAAGANVNTKDRWGHTALDDAAQGGYDDVCKFLTQNGAAFGKPEYLARQLNTAASQGMVDEVKRLLQTGVPVNITDFDHRTPLHHAAGAGQLEICKVLIENKADISAADRWGGTPLSDAVRSGVRTGSDAVRDLLIAMGGKVEESKEEVKNPHFARMFAFWQVAFILLFWFLCEYADTTDAAGPLPQRGPEDTTELYAFWQDVHVMIFIGFGFLMTFLRKYGYSSIGINFLIGAYVLQWYTLVSGFWTNVFKSKYNEWHKVPINLSGLILGDFCAAAVLITFGGLLGKTSITQMLAIATIEVVLFSLNEQISLHMEISDIGGSMVIHTFGAVFGLVASRFLTPENAKGRSDNAAVYRSDLFAMIGTIFLWLFWPSFNGAFGLGDSRQKAIINTLFSLTGACVSAFAASHYLRHNGDLSMVDIQNATLAGGVAMGAVANMNVTPGGAITLGVVLGAFSVFGYVRIQPFLESKLGIHDTCGINNLHGMPGFAGGIASIIMAGLAKKSDYGYDFAYVWPKIADGTRTAPQQSGQQAAFLFITIGIAAGGGFIAAQICKHRWFDPCTSFFLDDATWEVPGRETPYYFDHRGEFNRDEIKDAVSYISQMEEADEISKSQKKQASVRNRMLTPRKK